MSSREDVLDFWFGSEQGGVIPQSVRARWWKKDPAFDEEIRQRFGELHAQAAAGELIHWCATPEGRVAVVIVLDQFSRNMFRNDPRAWAQDELALRYVREAIEAGDDTKLRPYERAFLYMPLMHAEDRVAQQQCVDQFETLVSSCEGEIAEHIAASLGSARKHQVIVERFGRFPHRNAALSRETTTQEKEFLAGPGSSF